LVNRRDAKGAELRELWWPSATAALSTPCTPLVHSAPSASLRCTLCLRCGGARLEIRTRLVGLGRSPLDVGSSLLGHDPLGSLLSWGQPLPLLGEKSPKAFDLVKGALLSPKGALLSPKGVPLSPKGVFLTRQPQLLPGGVIGDAKRSG
jgi:hypothetical protein